MSRELDPELELAIGETITAPVFLVEINLAQRTYRLTSFDDVIEVLDTDWFEANVLVKGPVQKSGATLHATVTVPFDTEQAGGILMDDILSQRPQDAGVRIFKTYFAATGYTEPVLMLDGVIDDVSLGTGGVQKQRLQFTVVSRGNRSGVTPFIRVAPPLLNHITPAGSVVSWNGARYEVDS